LGGIFLYKVLVETIPEKLTIGTGHETGGYYKFATLYKEVLKKEGIDLQIVQTAGSVEALKLLSQKKIDIAFAQGGTASNYHDRGLLSLASVFYEPLWVFYREDSHLNYLYDLKGKKVSIGERGSGSKALFEILFKENGFETQELLNLPNYIALNKLKRGEIDAFCLVISPESPLIKELLNTKNIKLMSFQRQQAYKDKYEYINSVKLGQGVIDLARNIPAQDVKLLATTASLVTHKTLNNNLQRLLIKSIKGIHQNGGIFEPKNYFPAFDFVEIEISEYTKSYLENGETWAEKHLPFWFSSLVEALLILILPLIPILIIFVKGVLPSYALYFRHKLYLWKNEIHQLEITMDRGFIGKEEMEQQIEKIFNTIRKSCIIYFFYTQNYYNLILDLEVLKNRLKRDDRRNEEEENS
jgi:TRAP transporter TAXI family solute receptor